MVELTASTYVNSPTTASLIGEWHLTRHIRGFGANQWRFGPEPPRPEP
jgi:hypothetical protein